MNAKSVLASPEDKTQTEFNEQIILQTEWFISPDHIKVRKKSPQLRIILVFFPAGNLRFSGFLSIPSCQLSFLSTSYLYFHLLYRVIFAVKEIAYGIANLMHPPPSLFHVSGETHICLKCGEYSFEPRFER